MRIIYLFAWLFIMGMVQMLPAQELVPLSGNDELLRYHQKSYIAPVKTKKIQLKANGINTCKAPTPGLIYVEQGIPFTTVVDIDTVGLDTLPGTYSCVNCNMLQFGGVTLQGDTLTYMVNADTEAGQEDVTVEFCNPNGCRTESFQFIARRKGQSIFPTPIILNPEASIEVTLDTTVLPGVLDCVYLIDCEDDYDGRAQTFTFIDHDPVDFRFTYTASRFGGVDSICIALCDTFGICDVFRYGIRILQDTIGIPFMDDFSEANPLPNQDRWLDNEVFINRSMGIDPPSVGVATFDGVDQTGSPYGGEYGVSDRLTSAYFDLRNQAEGNVFLRYWVQRKGLGDKPEPQDSLVLEFKDRRGNWNTIRNFPGAPLSQPNTVEDPFEFFSETLDNEYFYNGFQFRFKNYSNRTGILDTWHLDYVRLDNVANDSIFDDLAFVTEPLSILNGLRSMPWRHFQPNVNNWLKDSIATSVRNFDDLIYNTLDNSSVSLRELNTNIELFETSGSREIVLFNDLDANFPPQAKKEDVFPLMGDDRFPSIQDPYFSRMAGPDFNGFDRLEFLMTYTIPFENQESSMGYESVATNDQVQLSNVFDNYFAYDDGTAEAGFVAQEGNTVVVKFTASVEDSLRAVQFHFPHTSVDISEQLFHLKVWVGSLEGDPVYERFDITPFYASTVFDSLQGFTTYVLKNEVGQNTPLFLPVGDFYVGWEQASACDGLRCIPVGYDRNSPEGKAAIRVFNGGILDTTITSLLPEGSLMLRPIVGSTTPSPTVSVRDRKANAVPFTVFPNPAKDVIQIQLEPTLDYSDYDFILYNSTGQVLKRGRLADQLSLNSFQSGVYWLKINDRKTQAFGTRQIIVNP